MKGFENATENLQTTAFADNFKPPIVVFKTGETLIVDKERNELQLYDGNKNLQLIISSTENGLVLNMNALQINIQALNQLNLSGTKVNIEASEQINIKTFGSLVQQIEKDVLTEIGGTNKMIAQVQKITATLGSVEIKANDDVRLEGERLLLNCD